MRSIARYGLGLFGLALLVAPNAQAQAPVQAADGNVPAYAKTTTHQHKGLMGWRHCVECQRARAKSRDGVDVPPPPAFNPQGVAPGQLVHNHPQVATECLACQAGEVIVGPVTIVDSYPAGHAVAGGPAMAANAPGYAVVGGGAPAMAGADPAPVGVSRSGMPRGINPGLASAGSRPAPGSYDPSVLPSSMIPAQTAMGSPASNRPRVVSHMLGVPSIGRHYREERAKRSREQHAAISYESSSEKVSELPASMVYGRGR